MIYHAKGSVRLVVAGFVEGYRTAPHRTGPGRAGPDLWLCIRGSRFPVSPFVASSTSDHYF